MVLSEKTLEELAPVAAKEVTENPIEPTAEEIDSIIALMKAGKSDKDIKIEVRRVVLNEDGSQKSAQGFSYAQLAEIRAAWESKLAELAAKAAEIDVK